MILALANVAKLAWSILETLAAFCCWFLVILPRIIRADAGACQRRYLVKYGVYFGITITTIAALILYFGKPYKLLALDLAVWVIALGYAFGFWGFAVVAKLLAEKIK